MSEQQYEPLDQLEAALKALHPDLIVYYQEEDESSLIRIEFETRTIEVSAWSDGVTAVAQGHNGEPELLDLDAASWAILDVVRTWQKSVENPEVKS